MQEVFYLKKMRRLSQALLISGALNMGAGVYIIYSMMHEGVPYFELNPISYETQQMISAPVEETKVQWMKAVAAPLNKTEGPLPAVPLAVPSAPPVIEVNRPLPPKAAFEVKPMAEPALAVPKIAVAKPAEQKPAVTAVNTPKKIVKKDEERMQINSVSSAKRVNQPYRLYIVQEGDSLWKISRRFGVDMEVIKRANELQSNAIQPGTMLKIPGKDGKDGKDLKDQNKDLKNTNKDF
jgi:LysM repeat protein